MLWLRSPMFHGLSTFQAAVFSWEVPYIMNFSPLFRHPVRIVGGLTRHLAIGRGKTIEQRDEQVVGLTFGHMVTNRRCLWLKHVETYTSPVMVQGLKRSPEETEATRFTCSTLKIPNCPFFPVAAHAQKLVVNTKGEIMTATSSKCQQNISNWPQNCRQRFPKNCNIFPNACLRLRLALQAFTRVYARKSIAAPSILIILITRCSIFP